MISNNVGKIKQNVPRKVFKTLKGTVSYYIEKKMLLSLMYID